MDNVTDAPKVVATHGKNALAKIPKPVLIAGGVGVVGFIWYKKKQNAAVTSTSNPANATPVADQGATNQSYTPPGDVTGSIASPYAGYGNVGNYNTGLPTAPAVAAPSGSSDTTVQAQLGDVSQLIGTLFPGGLPLGSGPVTNPFPGQGISNAPQAPPAPGVMTVGAPPTPVVTYSPPPAPAPAHIASTCPPSYPLQSARGCYKSVRGSTGHYNHIYQNGVVIGGNSR